MYRKLIDGFTFYNELDMLDFRLKELNSIVDKFIVVEATKTFQGNNKPLFFNENKNRFSKYTDKIIHIIIDDMPCGSNNWDREIHQRNGISRGFQNITNTDIVIIADLDEIPDINTLQNIKNNGLNEPIALEMDFYYYNLEVKCDHNWYLTKVLPYKNLLNKTPQEIRYAKHGSKETLKNIGHKVQAKGGWHFSYFGNENMIIQKIQSFSHSEFNKKKYLNAKTIKECIKKGEDIFFRGLPFNKIKIEDNHYLPKNHKMLIDF